MRSMQAVSMHVVDIANGRVAHSLHAYFLRPGDPTVPIVYEVDRIRDGKSFVTRRVVARWADAASQPRGARPPVRPDAT